MLNEIISVILQIGVFTLIPFIAYRFFYKNKEGFWNYIGLKKAALMPILYAVLFALPLMAVMLIIIHLSPDMLEAMEDPKSMSGKFKAMGMSFNSVVLIVLAAVFKTALAEEILFRGFLAKRLISKMGFTKGNILQAFIFGIIHTALFLSLTKSILFLTFIFIVPFVVGLVLAWINEKLANGSIIPSWLAHASGNLFTYLFFALN